MYVNSCSNLWTSIIRTWGYLGFLIKCNVYKCLNFRRGACSIHEDGRMRWWESIPLTDWGRVTHKCLSKLAIIGSDNGLSPGRRQAIIWTNAEILLIGPLGTNFSEISIEIYKFSFKKINSKVSSGKWRPSSLGLNVLTLLVLAGTGVFHDD